MEFGIPNGERVECLTDANNPPNYSNDYFVLIRGELPWLGARGENWDEFFPVGWQPVKIHPTVYLKVIKVHYSTLA